MASEWHLSDNGKAVILAAIAMIGGVATLWVQSHYQHAERVEAIEAQTKQLKAIEAKLENHRPVVYGK